MSLLLLVEESFGKNTFHSDENGIIGYNGEDLKTKEREDMRWRIELAPFSGRIFWKEHIS